MSEPRAIVTRSNGWAKLASLPAVAVIAAGAAYLAVGDSGSSSSLVTVGQIRNIARVSTVEYHVSEFYRGEVGRGRVEGAIYLSAVVTGSVDIDRARIELDSDSETPHATITIPSGAIHISAIRRPVRIARSSSNSTGPFSEPGSRMRSGRRLPEKLC